MNQLLANQANQSAITAILLALPALIVGVTAFVKAKTTGDKQAVQIESLQKQQDKQGTGGSPTTIVAVPPAPVGAGRAPLAAPVWNQLNDPLPDAQQDPQATMDCGEESVAMAIAGCGGPSLPAGVLRMLLGGPGRPGTSSATDLVYLLGLFGIKAHARQADADTAWTEWQHSFDAHYLVLALGYWVSPGYLHWVLVRETSPDVLTFNDPWGGIERTLTKATAQKLYAGLYVHVDQAVSAPAPAPPHD